MRKVISLALIAVFIFAAISPAAMAAGEERQLPEQEIMTEEEIQAAIDAETAAIEKDMPLLIDEVMNADYLTEEQKLLALDKLKLLLEAPSASYENARKGLFADGGWKKLQYYPWHKSVEENYCVAATAQSMLTYLLGGYHNQWDLADDLEVDSGEGGNFELMKDVMNERLRGSSHSYVYLHPSLLSYSTFESCIYTDIYQLEIPTAVSFKTSMVNGWWTSIVYPHASSVAGMMSDKNTLYVCDPALTYQIGGNPKGFVEIGTSSLHNGIFYTAIIKDKEVMPGGILF